MNLSRRWSLQPADAAAALDLGKGLKSSHLLAQALLNRGVAGLAECQDFLSPTLRLLHAPGLLPGVLVAAERVARAVRANEKIVIYGDYDVDGITATTILWHAIRRVGGNAEYYIPHRIEEGYGLNAEAITHLCDGGARLIISVDCGVTAIEQATIARARGVDLIITDHHEWKVSPQHEETGRGEAGDQLSSAPAEPLRVSASAHLPDCYAIVHPRLPHDGAAYPNPSLCGAGVAFKLAWGLGLAMSRADRVSDEFRAFLVDATALAALGTIADVVPLTGENRVLAHFGLRGLRQSKLTGLRALIASAALTGQKLDSYDVGFRLAPRLNACGRMGHARLAVEMLTSADVARAEEIATYLEQQNRARQAIEKAILAQAIAQVHEQGDLDGRCGLVLAREDWHPGVIGIVASRIVDRFHRPTVMIALNNGTGQGSARSIQGFHLARAFDACGEHLETFGGHEMAAGLKMKSEKVADFREAFCHHAGTVLSAEQLLPQLRIDCVAELPQITEALVTELGRLAPFGQGNPRPVLCFQGLQVTATPRRVGASGDHLQLHVRQGEQIFKCIAFGFGALDADLSAGTNIDIAVELKLNEFNGRTSVELEVKDLKILSPAPSH